MTAAAARAGLLAACALLAGCVTSPGPGLPEAPTRGYLAPNEIQRLAEQTPPPAPFDAQRGAATLPPVRPGTDRWWLAIAHAELRPPEAAQHFDCVLETRLAGQPRPALTRLMNRLLIDSGRLSRILATGTPRPRPITEVDGLEPCQRVNVAMRNSSSWPAGGAVVGAAYGELFAALAPDRAEGVRRIGREIGLSRAVCHMNWPDDVTAGARLGARLYARVAEEPDFQADLEAARAEVAAARAEGLISPGCAAERRALRPDAA